MRNRSRVQGRCRRATTGGTWQCGGAQASHRARGRGCAALRSHSPSNRDKTGSSAAEWAKSKAGSRVRHHPGHDPIVNLTLSFVVVPQRPRFVSDRFVIDPVKVKALKRRFKVVCERVERTSRCGFAPDKHVIVVRFGMCPQDTFRHCPQPPLRTVPYHRAADLSADGETDTRWRNTLSPCFGAPFFQPGSCLQDKSRCRVVLSQTCDSNELAALFQALEHGVRRHAERRLRPLALRLARIRRPPTVALRARNPWRRLRTKTLG